MSGEPQTTGFEAELTDSQRELLSRLADKVVRLRMTTPAILFLESVRPLNFVGSQVMVFFAPLVRGFFNLPEWDELRLVLEQRESIGYFLDLIESREAAAMEEERRQKRERKAEKKRRRASRKVRKSESQKAGKSED